MNSLEFFVGIDVSKAELKIGVFVGPKHGKSQITIWAYSGD